MFDVILRVIKKSTMLMRVNLFTHKASGRNFKEFKMAVDLILQ